LKNCGSSPSFTVCAADKKIVNPSVNTGNNRLSTSDNYAFDTVGNTTGDAEGRTFVYDAENKQISVSEGATLIGQYSYDGDGKRIKKYVPDTGETTIFVYDAGSKLIGEYSTVVETGSNAKTVYTTNDHLGSPRINTDGVGAVISRHDYHPFGEEVARTGYGSDTIRKQFTGYERDDETELDFAQARYYLNLLGRFSTPDDFTKDSSAEDPQSWNKYVFVRNSPLNLVDPTGEKATVTITTDKEKKTGTIVITASFGVYAQQGQYSAKELQKQADTLKAQIEETYKGGFVLDGITYTVSASVSTQIFDSETSAAAAGAEGKVDNIVGLRKSAGFNIAYDGQTSTAVGSGYNIANEDFDRMVIATGASLNQRNTYAHEFGHLINAIGTHSSPSESEGVMRDGYSGIVRGRYLTNVDFDMMLAGPSRKHVTGTGGPFPNRPRGVASAIQTNLFRATTTQIVRASHTFNNVTIP
jgi:RHS repeat-associated protein